MRCNTRHGQTCAVQRGPNGGAERGAHWHIRATSGKVERSAPAALGDVRRSVARRSYLPHGHPCPVSGLCPARVNSLGLRTQTLLAPRAGRGLTPAVVAAPGPGPGPGLGKTRPVSRHGSESALGKQEAGTRNVPNACQRGRGGDSGLRDCTLPRQH